MVAGVFDGQAVRLYVDGIEAGSGTPAPGAEIKYDFSGSDFYFDGYPIPECGTSDFPGRIDEVRLYNRALNRSELRRMAIDPGLWVPVLEPDGDNDFTPDSRDNCPTVPNPDQGDSVADGLGNGCEGPPVARFVVAPNPTCVGTPTVLNATPSIAGENGPIREYRYEYTEPVGFGFTRSEPIVLSSSASPVATVSFPWGTSIAQRAFDPFRRTVWVRGLVPVTLTITDQAGATSSAVVEVDFAQRSSSDSREGCPSGGTGGEPVSRQVPVFDRANAGGALTTRGTCSSGVMAACVGEVVAVLPSLELEARRIRLQQLEDRIREENEEIARRVEEVKANIQRLLDLMRQSICGVNCRLLANGASARRFDVVARARFRIPAGQSARVRAPLSKPARRFLRRYRRLPVTLATVALSPTGKRLVRLRRVTLRAR